MNAQQLHKLTKKVSDWKILLGVGVVVITTIFNFISGLFNFAIVTKLEPIIKEVSAIKGDVSEIRSVTDNLPVSYVNVSSYREDVKEIKNNINTLLEIHLR